MPLPVAVWLKKSFSHSAKFTSTPLAMEPLKKRRRREKSAPVIAPKKINDLQSLLATTVAALPWILPFVSILTIASISPLTLRYYVNSAVEFGRWVDTLTSKPRSLAQLDHVIHIYFVYLIGEGLPAHLGNKTMAAMAFFLPHLGSRLNLLFPSSIRALKGWHRLAPATTRKPMPLLTACALAVSLIAGGQICMGLALLLGFSSYLRPRELTSLRACQLVGPALTKMKIYKAWCLILHPEEQALRSKAGLFDESVRCDSDYLAWMTPFFSVLTKRKGDSLQRL